MHRRISMETILTAIPLDLSRRRRNLGLTGGSIWLVTSGTAFAAFSLVMVRSRVATTLLVTISALAAVLIVIGISMLRALLQLQDDPSLARPSQGRRLGRQFGT